MPEKNLVHSVTKALKIIELLAREDELALVEISQKLGLEKSTAFRLIQTLKENRFVVQNENNKKYGNGYKLFELGQKIPRRSDTLRSAIYPYMKEIAERTGETVNLAVRDGLEVIYIEMIQTEDIIKINDHLGQRRPVFCTSVGKSLLAWLPESELEDLIRRIEFHPYTPYTVTNPDQLRTELNFIRENGYFIDTEQHATGIRCYGTPVLNDNREPIAGLSISVPQYKFEKNPEKEDLYISSIREAVSRFSKDYHSI